MVRGPRLFFRPTTGGRLLGTDSAYFVQYIIYERTSMYMSIYKYDVLRI